MNRFYLPRTSIEGDVVRFSEEQRKQIHNVLRMRTGDAVVVFDGSGLEYAVELVSTEVECTGRIIGSKVLGTEPNVNLTLIQSLPKGEKTEWIIQKGTEVGVSRFIFMTTLRSVPSISADKLPGRLSRWWNIAKEAAEQSGRACVPEVDGILTFKH
ncbi:MAG: RsmE family RNA methyltransferase, partial [Armatimonadota bacterium]